MAETVQQALRRLRKDIRVPRFRYLEAVRRHDARIAAAEDDARPWRHVALRIEEAKASIEGTPFEPIQGIEDPVPDPAMFDPPADVARDDIVIGAYLARHPNETRRPLARGRSVDELVTNWRATEEHSRRLAAFADRLDRACRRLRDRIVEDDASPARREF